MEDTAKLLDDVKFYVIKRANDDYNYLYCYIYKYI